MREILFRGKRIDNGEWVEGYYCCLGNKYHYILSGVLDITNGYPDLVKNPVIPETVGQYTGLTDKNGKLIFEGDILRFYDVETKHESNGYAVIHYGRFKDTDAMSDFDYLGWYLTITTIPNEATTIFVMEEQGLAFEIIGNIHDNPELLKGTD